jgi:hypothetical protein
MQGCLRLPVRRALRRSRLGLARLHPQAPSGTLRLRSQFLERLHTTHKNCIIPSVHLHSSLPMRKLMHATLTSMHAAPICGSQQAVASGGGVRALLRAASSRGSGSVIPPSSPSTLSSRGSAFAMRKPPPPRPRFTVSTERPSSLAVSAAADGGGERDSSSGGPQQQRPERRMDTHYTFTEELFTDAFQFVIPIYQRPYEWGTTEMEQLMRDLEVNLDAQVDDVNELEVRACARA